MLGAFVLEMVDCTIVLIAIADVPALVPRIWWQLLVDLMIVLLFEIKTYEPRGADHRTSCFNAFAGRLSLKTLIFAAPKCRKIRPPTNLHER